MGITGEHIPTSGQRPLAKNNGINKYKTTPKKSHKTKGKNARNSLNSSLSPDEVDKKDIGVAGSFNEEHHSITRSVSLSSINTVYQKQKEAQNKDYGKVSIGQPTFLDTSTATGQNGMIVNAALNASR
jgi:hypothetical protein